MTGGRVATLVVLHIFLALTIRVSALAATEALLDFGGVGQVVERLARTWETYRYALGSERGRSPAICVTLATLALPTCVALRAGIHARHGRLIGAGSVALSVVAFATLITPLCAAAILATRSTAYISVQGLLALTVYEFAFVVWEVIYIPVAVLAHRIAVWSGLLRAMP